MTYDFWCKKCKKIIERVCKVNEIGNQKCKCGTLMIRYYGKTPEVRIPAWWTNPNNSMDLAKPQTELQRQRQREFYENSEPYH